MFSEDLLEINNSLFVVYLQDITQDLWLVELDGNCLSYKL